MKITAAQYAQTLHDLTDGKEKSVVDAIVKEFIKLLAKNSQLKLADKIAAKFSEIYNRERGIAEAEAVSRENLDGDLRNKVEKFVQEKYEAKEVVLNNKVDETIKGGIVIKIGDEILDASVAGKLKGLGSLLKK